MLRAYAERYKKLPQASMEAVMKSVERSVEGAVGERMVQLRIAVGLPKLAPAEAERMDAAPTPSAEYSPPAEYVAGCQANFFLLHHPRCSHLRMCATPAARRSSGLCCW